MKQHDDGRGGGRSVVAAVVVEIESYLGVYLERRRCRPEKRVEITESWCLASFGLPSSVQLRGLLVQMLALIDDAQDILVRICKKYFSRGADRCR